MPPQERKIEVFSPRYYENYILNENLTQRWPQSGLLIPKLEHFLGFLKNAGKASLFPLVTRLPCLAEDKVSNVNSDVQRLHENIK